MKPECFIKNIRFNTLYIYDKDGYIRSSNPRSLICRNEKDKIIILKDRPYYSRGFGGVTALMISDGKIPGALNVTTISYHDWAGIVWFIFLTTLSVYGICNGGDFGPVVLVLSFILLMNGLNIRQLRRQKAFIEEMIKRCENQQ